MERWATGLAPPLPPRDTQREILMGLVWGCVLVSASAVPTQGSGFAAAQHTHVSGGVWM